MELDAQLQHAYCIKNSNKQTLSTFLEQLHSFPSQTTTELANHTQQKLLEKLHPKAFRTKSKASSKPRLPQVALGWWRQILICKYQVILKPMSWNFMGNVSSQVGLSQDYPKYCKELRMIMIALPEIRHWTHPLSKSWCFRTLRLSEPVPPLQPGF